MATKHSYKKEVQLIKAALWPVMPVNVDKASIIIALSEMQSEIAELIISDDPQETLADNDNNKEILGKID